MRLVFDTNVIINALLFEGSKPSRAFDIGIKHGVILFSSSTLAELEEVLSRDKFDQYVSHEERKQSLQVHPPLLTPPLYIRRPRKKRGDPKAAL